MAAAKTAGMAYGLLRAAFPARMGLYDQQEGGRDLFLAKLMEIPDQLLLVAVHRLVDTRTAMNHVDNPTALVREAVGEIVAESLEGEDIAGWIACTMRREGRTFAGPYPTPDHERAVRDLGGWVKLCNGSEQDFGIALAMARKSDAARVERLKLDAARNPRAVRIRFDVRDFPFLEGVPEDVPSLELVGGEG